MILSIDAETVLDKVEPQFLMTFKKKKHYYQIRNLINFLNFVKVISQEPVATLYLMKNFRCFPYKIESKETKSPLALLTTF